MTPTVPQLKSISIVTHNWLTRFNRNLVRRLNRVFRARNPLRSIRFALRTWDSVRDIGIASRMLEVDCFRKEIVPKELSVSEPRRYYVIAPHQDDETIGAGGALLLASDAGAAIHVLYLTDGAQEAKPGSPAALAKIRQQEAFEVTRALGASVEELGLSNLRPQPTLGHLQQIADSICRFQPDVLLLPWLLDSPARHRMASHLLWLAHATCGLPDLETWGYQVHTGIISSGYVDITGVACRKLELLRRFSSQNIYRHYDHVAMGMAAANSRFLGPRAQETYAELFCQLPLSEVLRLVERFYFRDFRSTYLGDEVALQQVVDFHHAVTANTRRKRKA